MIKFNPSNPHYTPEMAHAFESFDQAIKRISEIYQSKSTSLEDQKLVEMGKENLRQAAQNNPHPTIQYLASKILKKIENPETLKETDLSDFLNEEILLHDFTPSKTAFETVIETIENASPESLTGSSSQKVTWEENNRSIDLPLLEVKTFFPPHLTPLLGPVVFANLMKDCASFFQEHQEYLSEGYDLINLEPTHLVAGISKRKNVLILSDNSLTIHGYDIFKVQSDDPDMVDSKNYIAARLSMEIPLSSLRTSPLLDIGTPGLKTDYKISQLFSSREDAEAFLSKIDQTQEELMPNFTPPRNPKKELISILEKSTQQSEEKALKQLVKDLHRMGDITFIKGDTSVVISPPENGQEENVLLQLSHLLGEQSDREVDDKLGRTYLSKIAELLSQTPWANLTEGIQKHPMHRVNPSLYEPFISTEELSKQIPDTDNPIFLLAENQSIRIKKSEKYITIENGCIFKFQHTDNPTHRFVSVKIIAQLPDELPLDRSQIKAVQFISHVCETKEKALALLPLLETSFPKTESEAMESPSGLPLTSNRTSSRIPSTERENLKTTAKGGFIRKQTESLNQEQAKDAIKGRKPKET